MKHDLVGKVIHGELSKKFKFDHTNKSYMNNQDSVLENETHKLLWDFEIQTDHLIPARRSDLIKKKNCRTVKFAVPADHRVKLKESEKKDKSLDLAKKVKRLWNTKVTIILIVALGTITKGLIQGL